MRNESVHIKLFLLMLLHTPGWFNGCVLAQERTGMHTTTDSAKSYRPEILTSGFFDVISNGQVNASARFIRLYIGEPGKMAIPLSIYSGVSSNNFQQNTGAQSNGHLYNNFINPLSGLANISMDGVILLHHKMHRLSRHGIIYQLGEKILSGTRSGAVTDPLTGTPVNFLNSYADGGFYLQTGAWERNDTRNVGIFWMAFRYIACYSSPQQLREMIPGIITNGWYHGFSIGWGVDINSLVNIKVLYYKYVKPPEMDYGLPIYQFSFHYALK